MGKVMTAFQLRLQRARKLVSAGAVQANGAPDTYDVKSQSVPGLVYRVQVVIDQSEEPGHVVRTHCECPDWERMDLALWEYPMNPGISHVHYCPACKHVLSVLLELGAFETLAP